MSGAFDSFTPDDSGRPAEERSTREGDRPFGGVDDRMAPGHSHAGHVDLADLCIADLHVVASAVDRWRSLRPPFAVVQHSSR